VNALLMGFGAAISLIAWFLCLLFSKSSSIFYVLDEVTDRSLHNEPKPRTGGLAIVSTIFLGWLVMVLVMKDEMFHYSVMIGVIILSVVSYLDDRKSMSKLWRLLVHSIAAFLMVFSVFGFSGDATSNSVVIENWLVVYIFVVLMSMWCINLYNFMDGIDGLAGGMGVIGFSCLAWFGWAAGHQFYFLLACVVAASNFGFILHNYPPAKIFMGDVGSTVMGYLVAFLSLWGWHENIFSWWVPLLVFSPFFVDATTTLARRCYLGERFWEAHKTHYYQKLVQIGLGHAKTVVLEYVLMFSVACTAVVLHLAESNLLTMTVLGAWLIIYLCIIGSINYLVIKSRVMG